MKKGDLRVGEEYAVVSVATPIPAGGISELHGRTWRAGSFPMDAERVRVVELGVEYTIPGRTHFDGPTTKTGIRVEWLKERRTRAGRQTARGDSNIITSARYVFAPWAEYEPERDRRAVAQEAEQAENTAAQEIQERVLARLEALGVKADEYALSGVTLEAVEVERLLDAAGKGAGDGA